MKKDSNLPRPLGPEITLQVLQLTIERSATEFVHRWNEIHPDDMLDLRFTINRGKVAGNGKVKAQISLTLEIKENTQWSVLVRKIVNLESVAAMERNDVLLRLELWSGMFAEVTHMGFIGGLNMTRYRQQANDQQPQGDTAGPDQAADEPHVPAHEVAGEAGS